VKILHQFVIFGSIIYYPFARQFHTKSIRTSGRIGPHDSDVISVLVGCLLGDCYAKKSRALAPGTSFRFRQSTIHREYLFYLYEFLNKRGYCNSSLPREYRTTLVNVKTKVNKTYYGNEFDTFSFSSFNWLYDLFYFNGTKIISPEIENYFSPLSLAHLIMDDGGWTGYGVRIATNNFTVAEVELLQKILKNKFNLDSTVQLISNKGSKRTTEKYSLYIIKASVPELRELILPYVHSSMVYKLGL
jgi:hypothetical protein